jgi:tagaturonate reductase
MILQFGAGNFLRSFVDLFAAQLNRDATTAVGPVHVVQSTGAGRAEALNARGCKYHVAIQGFEKGEVVDRVEFVDSIQEVIVAATDWRKVLDLARDPQLRMIVSNTTEAGFALVDGDSLEGGAPQSFPAKLLACLLARHAAGGSAVEVIPCELIERNGERLCALVLEQARRWNLPDTVTGWIRDEVRWVNNLVDRIVPGTPKQHALLAEDPLLLSAEPYALWAIETTGSFAFHHPAVVNAPDISPYYLQKVRILNGMHSALVCHALPMGIATVREAVEHAEVGPWLEALLFEEIVPMLEGRVSDPTGFAKTTLDRFRNPFLEHQLTAIALNHADKVKVRLQPTYEEYRAKFSKAPKLLEAALRQGGFV